MKKKLPQQTQAEQSARFVEAAKKAEADERPEVFDKTFASIAKQGKQEGKRK